MTGLEKCLEIGAPIGASMMTTIRVPELFLPQDVWSFLNLSPMQSEKISATTCGKVNPATPNFQEAVTIQSPVTCTLFNKNWEAELQQKMMADPAFKAYIMKIADQTGGTPKPSAQPGTEPY
jgi:hypothetical protein